MPFCHLQIKALRQPYPDRWKSTQGVPGEPQSLGQHIKAHRLRFHLLQKEVAATLGVHIETLRNWERGVGTPLNGYIPRIIQFLGFDPEPEPAEIPGRVVYARRRLGLTQEDLAKRLRVDPVTVYRWEKGFSEPSAQMLKMIDALRSPAEAITRQLF